MISSLPGKHDIFPHAGLMLGQRRRRWPNINTALAECIVFAGSSLINDPPIRSTHIFTGRSLNWRKYIYDTRRKLHEVT